MFEYTNMAKIWYVIIIFCIQQKQNNGRRHRSAGKGTFQHLVRKRQSEFQHFADFLKH